MNGGAQTAEMEHAEHEFDPTLVRTGRYERIHLILIEFTSIFD
jgi:hypothetical protein